MLRFGSGELVATAVVADGAPVGGSGVGSLESLELKNSFHRSPPLDWVSALNTWVVLSLLLLRTVVSGPLGTIWDHFPGNWEPE